MQMYLSDVFIDGYYCYCYYYYYYYYCVVDVVVVVVVVVVVADNGIFPPGTRNRAQTDIQLVSFHCRRTGPHICRYAHAVPVLI